METVFKIFVFVLIVGTASAATALGRLPPKPVHLAHKEGCFIREVNDVVPFGTTVTAIGSCFSIHCSTQFLEYASCGIVSTDDQHCHITDPDLSKPYPSCCPDIKCDLDNNIL